jgi:hypothetical protein
MVFLGLGPALIRYKAPELVEVNGGAMVLVPAQMEVTLTLLSEVTGMTVN